jgi:Tol biopolymer transport system component
LLAYVSFPEGILWKPNRDGCNPVQLSDRSMFAFLPRWSPDGTQIAFTGFNRKADRIRIYVVSPEGDSPPRPLVEDNERQFYPAWSPNGHEIAFS